jgi:hypothetical protein
MADNFVNTPMSDMFIKTGEPSGGPGEYDGIDCVPFNEFKRTSSPNGVKEKLIDGRLETPSGEPDQF